MSKDWTAVRDRLASFGQEHLLRWLEDLGEGERDALYGDISALDLG